LVEVQTAVPSHLKVEIGIAKLKKYKYPGTDQTPAELIQAGGSKLLPAIHKLPSLLSWQLLCRYCKLVQVIQMDVQILV
jgi:hypothetical protein